MVSDASARRKSGPISSIFALQPTPYDVDTVVMIADNTYDPGVTPAFISLRITGIPTTLQSQDGELLGALAMATIRRFLPADKLTDCGLDCMAVLQRTGLARKPTPVPRSWKADPSDQLTLAARLMNSSKQPPMRHVPAHLDSPKYDKLGNLKRPALERKEWKVLEHLQWAADQMADLTDTARISLHQHNAYPVLELQISAQELHDTSLHPGRFWQTADTFTDLQCREEVDILAYLVERQARSPDGIPWKTAQLGLLLPSLKTHPLWKYAHHRPEILRYAWDYIPHGRNQAKIRSKSSHMTADDLHLPYSLSPDIHLLTTPLDDPLTSEPIAPNLPTAALCPLCYAGFDDYHHLLVECPHRELCLRRNRIIRGLLDQSAKKSQGLPPAVGAYIEKFLGCLSTPDPLRLSHAIWLMRPFLPTLLSIDATMSHAVYPREVLVPLTEAIPSLMCSLFEEVAPLWRRRCEILAARHRSGPAPPKTPHPQTRRNTRRTTLLSLPIAN
jgi:hypothetical protein